MSLKRQPPTATLSSSIFSDNTNSVKNVTVAVVGVGYVGEQLVDAFSSKFRVIAFDISATRIDYLRKFWTGNDSIFPTSKESDLSGASLFLVSVPTLLESDKSLNTSHIENAMACIQKYAKPGSTIVVESSVCIGTTQFLYSNLKSGSKYFFGFSPERVDPGRKEPLFIDIPKIVSGVDLASTKNIHKYYSAVFNTVVVAASPSTAEMVKLVNVLSYFCQHFLEIVRELL